VARARAERTARVFRDPGVQLLAQSFRLRLWVDRTRCKMPRRR
jgi:hypothetical protein